MIDDLIPRSALVGLIMLRASDDFYRKGPVCYIITFYNEYSYSELSILFLFILSQYKPAVVHLMLLYFYLRGIIYSIMFYL